METIKDKTKLQCNLLIILCNYYFWKFVFILGITHYIF